MTAPPGFAPTPTLTPGAHSGDAFLAYLSRIARQVLAAEGVHVSNREALRLAREFAAARRDDRADTLRRRSSDARQAALDEFRAWFTRRGDIISMRSKPVAHDPRRHDGTRS